MTDGTVQPDGSTKVDVPSAASLTARALFPLVGGALVSIVAESLLASVIPGAALRVVISVGIGAGLTVAGLAILLIAPLTRSRADLQVRYQEAVADALRDPLTGLGNHRAFQ